jgi:transcriptional regulator with XRE-family HTH domain
MKINRSALADFMDREGLRITDLANDSKLSKSFLSELRSGTKVEVSAATAKRIADALGVRVRSITDPSEEMAA